MFDFFKVKLILPQELILLSNLAYNSRIDFYTQLYFSTHFLINKSKHKSLYLQLNYSRNQLYKIKFSHIHLVLHALSSFAFSSFFISNIWSDFFNTVCDILNYY